MLIDTHSHLYDSAFDEDREEAIQRAKAVNVNRLYLPNVDVSTVNALHSMADLWPDFCFPMMGLHPTSVKDNYREELKLIHGQFGTRKYWAVGEIGIDLYWDKAFFGEQKAAFTLQVNWANEMKLPIVIHSRDSIPQLIEILKTQVNSREGGVFHCFTGTEEQAREIIDLGFYLGIGGVLTFKNSTLAEVLKKIGPERLVLETDSPYLAPVPFRGKRNESSYLPIILSKLAEVLEMDKLTLTDITGGNAQNLFKS